MIFEEKISSQLTDLTDYYEVLDIKRHANSSEIRESYLRIKATYQKDNAALYTLISPSEREDMLRKIEEAYQVLSSPDLKREYDSVHAKASPFDSDSPFSDALSDSLDSPLDSPNIISIDRAPPMESFSGEENPLIAPTTDFEHRPASTPSLFSGHSTHPVAARTSSPQAQGPSPTSSNEKSQMDHPTNVAMNLGHFEKGISTTYQEPVRSSSRTTSPSSSTPAPTPSATSSTMASTLAGGAASTPTLSELDKEIAQQTHWTGPLLRKVRIGRGISIEEVTQATKITKAYILAIEEENYTKLPAPVFIRGFVSQMARQLRLPANDVTHSYMERAKQALPDKFKSSK